MPASRSERVLRISKRCLDLQKEDDVLFDQSGSFARRVRIARDPIFQYHPFSVVGLHELELVVHHDRQNARGGDQHDRRKRENWMSMRPHRVAFEER